jgi:hypothetical protein
MCIKGKPCKVLSVSTSKTGKHGHAKCNFTAQDIFTGKKCEDIVPSTHSVQVNEPAIVKYPTVVSPRSIGIAQSNPVFLVVVVCLFFNLSIPIGAQRDPQGVHPR